MREYILLNINDCLCHPRIEMHHFHINLFAKIVCLISFQISEISYFYSMRIYNLEKIVFSIENYPYYLYTKTFVCYFEYDGMKFDKLISMKDLYLLRHPYIYQCFFAMSAIKTFMLLLIACFRSYIYSDKKSS